MPTNRAEPGQRETKSNEKASRIRQGDNAGVAVPIKAFSDFNFYYPGFGTTHLSLFPSMGFIEIVSCF